MSNAQSRNRPRSSAFTLGLCVFLAIAAFFLWTEHRAHLFGILPYLFLIACVFVHVFMHRGGHGHGRHQSSSQHSGHGAIEVAREAGDVHRHREAS